MVLIILVVMIMMIAVPIPVAVMAVRPVGKGLTGASQGEDDDRRRHGHDAVMGVM